MVNPPRPRLIRGIGQEILSWFLARQACGARTYPNQPERGIDTLNEGTRGDESGRVGRGEATFGGRPNNIPASYGRDEDNTFISKFLGLLGLFSFSSFFFCFLFCPSLPSLFFFLFSHKFLSSRTVAVLISPLQHTKNPCRLLITFRCPLVFGPRCPGFPVGMKKRLARRARSGREGFCLPLSHVSFQIYGTIRGVHQW